LSEARFATPKVAFERSLLFVRSVFRTLLTRIRDMPFAVCLVGEALWTVLALIWSWFSGCLSRCGNLG
jgi:hypothetical protein